MKCTQKKDILADSKMPRNHLMANSAEKLLAIPVKSDLKEVLNSLSRH
jgi:hypothetical protein